MKKIRDLFSYREKKKTLNESIQLDTIRDESKNVIWSILFEDFWEEIERDTGRYSKQQSFFYDGRNRWSKEYFKYYWIRILQKPIDEFPDDWGHFYSILRKDFFNSNLFEIFDFLELILKTIDHPFFIKKLVENLNYAFEQENIQFRIIGSNVTSITNDLEISSINETLESEYSAVSKHMDLAISMLFSRNSPDYRNSIKESISGVEAICKIISKKDKATLSDALTLIEKKYRIHPALKLSLEKLYNYTSDEKGIRHSLLSDQEISFNEAKFMLISCSNFINYLKLISK
ncbi:hypothetical protein LEP1GSC202_0347 [Leptospira yanagawae serovar Saopaulo str. Sao Paulo = ATCC 700523]|uniref:HEPN AbiJ-N-terminal domain-containing protein n=1 Tax=Leptospira yanagawae serovar Saopaulo str. Sao Paulo = ATCC 700523 TaxID=1249483 RepID=A0A5E8HII9_9LEPT|nr:hypothetical protein [Leptospira yanagawae]EOQ90310.1 hypothetical protein LEP1GSC202_0347 [Leptospira yanagawae serovar Saopaulo str. Sao Paulo = ATCC 700523]